MYEETTPGWREKFGTGLDRIEHIYLRILRAVILILATILIAYAAWLVVSSTYKISRSAESVKVAEASVQADEITSAQIEETQAPGAQPSEPVATPAQRAFYSDFLNRYYGLYRTRFEPFRQREDKTLTRDEFDDKFVRTAAKLEGLATGELDFGADSGDLRNLLAIITEAAAKPETVSRLERYRAAKKVRVPKKVQRTRTEFRRGWDSYSTACEGWFYAPIGCAVRRAVQVPYSETIYALEFPQGTQSHTQIFQAFQERYFELLDSRREANSRKAQGERERIIEGNAEGQISLLTALQVGAAFLLLMFFFLLIAIERHQRRMSAALPAD